MEKRNTLHFSLDKTFGAKIHTIAYEHLVYNYDYKKAFDVFVSSGAPSEYWLKLLKGEYLITVCDDNITCKIVERNEVNDDLLTEYPPLLNIEWARRIVKEDLPLLCYTYKNIRYNYSYVCNYNIELTPNDIDYLYDVGLKDKIGNRELRAYMTLGIREVFDIWNNNNEKFIELLSNKDFNDTKVRRTYNDTISSIFNDLSYIKSIHEKYKNLISTINWLCEQYGWKMESNYMDFCNILKAVAYILLITKEKKYEDLEYFFTNEFSKNIIEIIEKNGISFTDSTEKVIIKKITDDMIDAYVEKENIIQEENIIQPVKATDFYDAGFISPDGDMFAMIGQTWELLHIQLADKIWNTFSFKVKPTFSKDFELMRMGWLKFHHNDVYYDACEITNIGYKDRPPTKQQLYKLQQFANANFDGIIYISGSRRIDTNDFDDMSEDEILETFDF